MYRPRIRRRGVVSRRRNYKPRRFEPQFADNVALAECKEEMGRQKLSCGVNVSNSEQKRSTKSVRRGNFWIRKP
jgi:hypothetical protein